MKERPILFSAPMINAILAGKKTQTRRIVYIPGKGIESKYGEIEVKDVKYYAPPSGKSQEGWADPGVNYWTYSKQDGRMIGNHIDPCPYGQVGDQLWVRETWGDADIYFQNHINDVPSIVAYKADHSGIQFDADPIRHIPKWDTDTWNFDIMKWKPSIFMPRWASRIQLEIVGIRVEKLKEINRGDCMAEGCPFPNIAKETNPQKWYSDLWESINGKGSWDLNPWVWVVEFKRVERPL